MCTDGLDLERPVGSDVDIVRGYEADAAERIGEEDGRGKPAAIRTASLRTR